MSRLRNSYTLLLACTLSLGLAACAPPDDPQAGPFDDYAGNAVLLPVENDPTVTFAVWFQSGTQDDPVGKEGLARLTASMISDGATAENSYQDILKKLYPIASGYGVRVDKEMTVLTGRTHRDNLDLFFQLYSDAYLRPAFDEADLDRLKKDQLNNLETSLRYAADEELGKAALDLAVYSGTRYAHPVSGTVEGLRSITLEDVKNFYVQNYSRRNAVLALGGGFDRALLDRFEATLQQMPQSPAPAEPEIATATLEGRKVTLVSKPGADASISFGRPVTVRRGTRDFYALWIANSWLGEHRNSSSHLYNVIRETRGMNYGDYSYIEAFPQGGFRSMPPTNVARDHQKFEVWIRTLPNEQAVFALRAALRELDMLIDNGLSEEQFQLTRSFLSKYHLHFATTTAERLGYLIDDRFYGIDAPGHLTTFGEMMSSITLDEVNAAVKKYLQTNDLEIAIVTGDAEGLTRQLTSGEPTPMSYSIEKPAEVLEEDKIIEAYALHISEDAVTVIPVTDIFEN
ncbi:MAG: insulinase family protein [Thermoanaerobaculia bacterium]|nr:insulinase family protein [Thermoanaerobaculia bacterium]